MAWISANRYLNEAEMQNNSLMVKASLTQRGWSLNAIAGILGNMERESTINPGIWQSLDEGNMQGGFGLVQWTPATNFIDWANAKGYTPTDGDAQLKWIDEETTNFGQWITTTTWWQSFESFKTSTDSPEYLASMFLFCFERAGVEAETERRTAARKWYNYLLENGGSNPDTPQPEDPEKPKKKKRKYNFILFNRRRRQMQ